MMHLYHQLLVEIIEGNSHDKRMIHWVIFLKKLQEDGVQYFTYNTQLGRLLYKNKNTSYKKVKHLN